MREEIKKMQKGELHVHLNGLISTDIVKKLLVLDKVDIPYGINLEEDLSIKKQSGSLISYLKPWQILRLIPKSKDSLHLMVDNAFKNLKLSNVTFVELRNSIIYIALLNNISVDVALLQLIEEIQQASEKYCIKSGLIMTIPRGKNAKENLITLLTAYVKLGKPDIVIGIDLAGDEETFSPDDIGYNFYKAKNDYGLKVTIHAGETGNPQNITTAIKNYHADRIGHGTAAYKSKPVMELLQTRNICVEICPISNRLTGAVNEKESHPVSEFIKMGVPFVICSDNPSIHGSSINEDYMSFYLETKNDIILKNMFVTQKRYSFLKV